MINCATSQTASQQQKAIADWNILKEQLQPTGEFASMSEEEAMQVAIDAIREVRREKRQVKGEGT